VSDVFEVQGATAAGRIDRALDVIVVQGATAAGKSGQALDGFVVPGVPDTAACFPERSECPALCGYP
jgi:hypothetical protein